MKPEHDERMTDKQRAILRYRARQLSAKPTRTEDTTDKTQVIVFLLGDEKFGIESKHIEEVQVLSEITAVPCTPEFVIGITNVRGNIFPVLDIRSFFDIGSRTITKESMTMLTSRDELEVCLLVDRIEGKRDIPRKDIKGIGSNLKNIKKEYLAGYSITGDEVVTLIDWPSFVREASIVVNEEA